VSLLSDEEFAEVRKHLADEAGLAFDESRRAGLAAILADRVRTIGAPDVAAYLAYVREEAAGAERQRLLDLVTVQETHFFRNPPQMEALRRQLLPELLRASAGRGRPLTVWSAGCSTGEEPYTLAMLLLELSPAVASRGARILATDVSAKALRAAARATYTTRSLGAMPPTVGDRWLTAKPGSAYEVKEAARRLVELRLHNLVTEDPPFAAGEVDLVVCRNVTIYFDRATTARVIGMFHDVLAPGGYLVLGHSETLWQLTDAFSLMQIGDAFVYRRAEAGDAPKSTRRRPAAHKPPARRRPLLPVPRTQPVEQSFEDLLAKAGAALAKGAYDKAARAAAAAVAVNSLCAPAYLVLGEAHAALGLDGKAATALRKAVYLEPQDAHAHFLLAVSLARLGQARQAAAAYRAAGRALVSGQHQDLDRFLGGRSRAELVGLCRILADEQDRVPDLGALDASRAGGWPA
jgi:chemotaxis protein methyltransferase CheR